MEVLNISEDILLEIEQDPTQFQGRIINLSTSPLEIMMHLDSVYAASRGVNRKQLAVQVAEDRIRTIASKKRIKTIVFDQDNVALENLSSKFIKENYIVMIKP